MRSKKEIREQVDLIDEEILEAEKSGHLQSWWRWKGFKDALEWVLEIRKNTN